MEKKVLALLFVLSLFSCSDLLQNDLETISNQTILDSKSYLQDLPLVTQDLSPYKSFEDKLRACQIPESLLSKLSTEKLVELCASFPLNGICYAHNDPMKGAQYVMNNFNGFQELKRRPDAAKYLLDFYHNINFSNVTSSPYPMTLTGKYGKKYSSTNINFIELVIASKEIPSLYTGNNIELLKEYAKKAYQQKSKQSAFGNIGLSSSLLVCSKLGILREENRPITSQESLNNSADKTLSTRAHSQQLTELYIYTSHGKKVLVYIRPELSRQEIKQINADCKREYPNVEILSDASLTYNCHYYAWCSTERYSEYYWLDAVTRNNEANLSKFWTNDFFIETPSEKDAKKIVYYENENYIDRNITHSAVKSNKEGYYISKWGAWPLVRHRPNDTPKIYGTNKRFFKYAYTPTEHGILECSNGSAPVLINNKTNYYIPNAAVLYPDTKRVEYIVETAKGDDAVEKGRAVITNKDNCNLEVYFTMWGTYNIFIRLYNDAEELIAEYTYEPLVLEHYNYEYSFRFDNSTNKITYAYALPHKFIYSSH